MIGLICQKELMLIKQIYQNCEICHYWFISEKNVKYKPYLCNGFQDSMQEAMTFNDLSY